MSNPTVSKADVQAFYLSLLPDPTTKKAQLSAKNRAKGMWHQLLQRCHPGGSLAGLLVVRCPNCGRTAEDCGCRRKISGDGKNFHWDHYREWVIERQSLAQIKSTDLLGDYMVKSTRENVMIFVGHLNSTA